MKNEEKPKPEKTDDGQINAKNEADSPDELTSLKEELEKAKKLLVSERNRRMFERLALKSNIRADRVDAAWRLSGFEQVAETLDEETVKMELNKIAANYPEFVSTGSPIQTDQSAPRKSTPTLTNDPLEMLKALREGK